jgi:hypothetical protein
MQLPALRLAFITAATALFAATATAQDTPTPAEQAAAALEPCVNEVFKKNGYTRGMLDVVHADVSKDRQTIEKFYVNGYKKDSYKHTEGSFEKLSVLVVVKWDSPWRHTVLFNHIKQFREGEFGFTVPKEVEEAKKGLRLVFEKCSPFGNGLACADDWLDQVQGIEGPQVKNNPDYPLVKVGSYSNYKKQFLVIDRYTRTFTLDYPQQGWPATLPPANITMLDSDHVPLGIDGLELQKAVSFGSPEFVAEKSTLLGVHACVQPLMKHLKEKPKSASP